MIEFASISETGEKPRNEDAVRVISNRGSMAYGFVLADGLGGHGNGDIASNYVCDCVGMAVEMSDAFDGRFLSACFQGAQDMLMLEKEQRGLDSIKTTMALLLIQNNIAAWGHIGDSRIYHFRDGRQKSVTMDHSVPQMLALSGKIREKDIRHHPDRSMLLHAMGSEWQNPEYEVDRQNVHLMRGDSVLLCSDGFWEWIEEKTMLKILKQGGTAYDQLEAMKAEVLKNGRGKGMDNYSAILVNVK